MKTTGMDKNYALILTKKFRRVSRFVQHDRCFAIIRHCFILLGKLFMESLCYAFNACIVFMGMCLKNNWNRTQITDRCSHHKWLQKLY